MIVLGPYTATIGTTNVQTPISTDVTAIGLLNASQFFMTVTSAGTYAQMAVPPYTGDVFVSPETASYTLTITFANLSSNQPVFNVSTYNTYYIYLYGSNDPVSQAINNGVATGYPYSLSGLHDSSPYRSSITGVFPNNITKNINVSTMTGNTAISMTIFDAYLWGFDLTVSVNSTTSSSQTLTITDVPNSGDVLSYEIPGLGTTVIPPLIVRFPFPLPIMGSQATNPPGFGSYQCEITAGKLGTATYALNVYSSQ